MRSVKRLTTSAVVLSLAVLLSGCSGGEPTSHGEHSDSSTGPATATPKSSPSGGHASGPHNEADVAFAESMLQQHRQAMRLSTILLAKDGIARPVRELAERIEGDARDEIETLQGWLAGWAAEGKVSEGDKPEKVSGGSQVRQLKAAKGKEAARLFLTAMTAHHYAATNTTQTELEKGLNEDAKNLAESISNTQQQEIAQMRSLLAST